MLLWQKAEYLKLRQMLRALGCIKALKPILNRPRWQHKSTKSKSFETQLVKQLKSRIKATGPITVAEYMKEVLSNPLEGYYMNKDVFGVDGDFITSPEISQMFGEMLGVWFYDQWLQCGSPQQFQFVELGPGRGTLVSDILRVFGKLGKIPHHVHLHLVEISPVMRKLQRNVLCGHSKYDDHEKHKETAGDKVQFLTKTNIPVTWHNIFEVPKGLSFYLAHEFFDALPIHQFQKTKHGWREVMVAVDTDFSGPHHLKFCLAPASTPATTLISSSNVDQLEIRPQAQIIVEHMAANIARYGGNSLIIDYGDLENNRHTLRAFQKHQLVNPLLEPGNLDLTSNVDFLQLKNIFNKAKVNTYGPATQQTFLMAMGINVRRQKLLEKATEDEARDIETAFKMLTDPEQMGECFKFLAAVGHNFPKPAGF